MAWVDLTNNWGDVPITVNLPARLVDLLNEMLEDTAVTTPLDAEGMSLSPTDDPASDRAVNDTIAAGLLAMLEEPDLRQRYLALLAERRLESRRPG